MNFEEGEVLLLDKPRQWTSFDVVNKLRFTLKGVYHKKLKVGHAGTLDPLATGLLIICTGKMTKRIQEFSDLDKGYTGTMHFGATTPTYDSELPPDSLYPTEHITEQLLRETVAKFMGVLEQFPPIYSAVKVDGRPAYQSARKGQAVELKSRRIQIYELEITEVRMPEVDFRVRCSKGTYIRSLVNDLGKVVNSGAYLKTLRRTKIGSFDIKDAYTVEQAVKLIENTEYII